MRRALVVVYVVAVALALGVLSGAKAATPKWSLNLTTIEACSCPMFCQCYFNSKPGMHCDSCGDDSKMAAGGMNGTVMRYCRFNNAFKVNKGSYGDVVLDGAKFWVAGDLGGDFTKGKMNWAVLTFDPSVTKEQRDALATVMGFVYPVQWISFNVAKDEEIGWNVYKDGAEANIGGGKTAHVVLKRAAGMNGDDVVMKNLKYWGAPRNDGFIMMPSVVEGYYAGDKPFEYKGTNGFVTTIDITSDDVASPQTPEKQSAEAPKSGY